MGFISKHKHISCSVRVILLMIYIGYACSITFFTHTHIINGVTIVHSHPFQKDSEGKPSHSHTGAELQLIQKLSSFQSDGQIQCTCLLEPYQKVEQVFTVILSADAFKQQLKGISRLRPPPFLFS